MLPPWFKNSPIMDKTRRDLALEDYETSQAQRAQAQVQQKAYDAAMKTQDPIVLELDTIKSCYTMLRNLESPARVRVWRYLAELLPVND